MRFCTAKIAVDITLGNLTKLRNHTKLTKLLQLVTYNVYRKVFTRLDDHIN